MLTGMTVKSDEISYTLVHMYRKEFCIFTKGAPKRTRPYYFLVDGPERDEWYQAAKHEFVDLLSARGVGFPEGMKPGLR